MSKFTYPMIMALLLASVSMTAAAANPADPSVAQCQARADGVDRPERPVSPAAVDADTKPAAKSRLLLPPGMNPRWHSFLPGMFR